MVVPQKYAQRPLICSSGINRVNSQRMMMLITIVKSPKLKIINGREMSFSIGRSTALKIAKTSPASNKSFQLNGKSKP